MLSFSNLKGRASSEVPRWLGCFLALHCTLGLLWGNPARCDESAVADEFDAEVTVRANRLAADVRSGRHPKLDTPEYIERELERKRAYVEDASSGLRQSIAFYRKFEELALNVDITDEGGIEKLITFARYMVRENGRIAEFRVAIARRRAEYTELYIRLLASRILAAERKQEIGTAVP